METYISKLDGARLYVGDAGTAVGNATEITRPLAGCVARKMNTLVVEPLPNGDVLIQGRKSNGKTGVLVVPREGTLQCMDVANALYDRGAHLPRWVRYAIDAPSRPIVVYWREKSIR